MTSARLLKVQAVSGLLFSAFLAVHIANTASAVFGKYDEFQRAARSFYHNSFIEIGAVAAALVVHVAVSLVLARRRVASRPPLWLRLHRLSGYVLTCFVFTHAFATRGVGLISHLTIAAQYVTFVLRAWPTFFYPYYALLVAAGGYHLISGLRLASGRVGLPLATRLRPAFIYIVSALVVAAGLLGIAALGGVFRPAPVPDEAAYRRYFERMLPRALQGSATKRR